MLTFLLIVNNQETYLKSHLQQYLSILKPVNGNMIIVDDGSTDSTKEYVELHFPDIKYTRNNFEAGFQKSFNKALTIISTPYLLISDPHIEITRLDLNAAIQKIKDQNLTALTFPCYQNDNSTDKKPEAFTATFKSGNIQCEPTKKTPTTIHFSETMLLNLTHLNSLHYLNDIYYSTTISWLDLIYRYRKHGLAIHYFSDCSLTKKCHEKTFFSYKINPANELKDTILFQWLHCHSLRFKWLQINWIIAACLTFKPKQLVTLIETSIKWIFHKKPKKNNWFVYKDIDILASNT